MGDNTGTTHKCREQHLIMSSGVAVSDECKTYFEDVKKGKKYRYVVYYIKDEKTIQVECFGERDAKYNDFLADLQKSGDSEYEHQHQGTTESSLKQRQGPGPPC